MENGKIQQDYNMQKDNINEFNIGLHLDNSPDQQPKGTYRFALNTVNETELGDFSKKVNEESNYECIDFNGYIPIGKVYTSDNEVVIFLVSSDNTVSEIGVFNSDNCEYTKLVNDFNSPEEFKLNFKLEHQIDATYRLRRGCERTVYFTDDYNKPRIINLDSLEDYKTNGYWNSRLFNLFRDYNNFPKFQTIEILDSGGQVLPGSYNIAVQYLDESLNPTEWITVSPIINIYNDLPNKSFPEINGSINSETDYLNFGPTSKAIKVVMDNLDTSFLYYRLAFVAANNGSGLVNTVEVTEVIPISKKFYIYTGNNAVSVTTEDEIKAVTEVIYKAKHIDQIENSLLLANTQGSQVEFCRLQKYASKIKADCILKEVNLSSMDTSNPKNPTAAFNGIGYMPGEIYSFGIVYVFKDGTLSPTYHIPGKSPNVANNLIYEYGPNVVPMSNIGNQSENTLYHDNDTCTTNNYWGLDSEGVSLRDKKVRHHKFPSRAELNIPLIELAGQGEIQEETYYNIRMVISGDLITPIPCDTDANPDCVDPPGNYFEIRIKYTVNGQSFYFTTAIDADTYSDGTGSYALELDNVSQFHSTDDFVITNIQVTNANGVFEDLCTSCSSYTWATSDFFEGSASITTEVGNFTQSVQSRNYKTKILGIQFSGIDIPKLEDTNGEEIVGYYIVRNERTDFEKTIIDTGVLVPTVKNNKYVAQGLFFPEQSGEMGKTEDGVWGIIHPEHKFNDKEYVTYDELIHEGNFTLQEKKLGKVTLQDVLDGSTYDSEIHKKNSQKDDDGWSLDIISRDNIVEFEPSSEFIKKSVDGDFENRFYLSALESRSIRDNAIDVYNIAADNKVGIIEFKEGEEITFNNKLPYVVMKRYNTDPYSNFRVLPYYKDSVNMEEFTNSTNNTSQIFGGDSYVTPMRYLNTMFWDNRIALRKGKTSVWKYILGGLLIAVGIVLAIFSGGTSSVLVVLGAGIMAASAGVLLVSSGIKADNMYKAYADEWKKGLRETTLDKWVDMFYNYRNTIPFGFTGNGGDGHDGPSDDTIQWLGDCVTDLWFESSINISLRHKMITEVPTFLDAPGRIESGNTKKIDTWEYFGLYWTTSKTRPAVSALEKHLIKKLLVFDGDRVDSRKLIGVPLGEYYKVNPDYHRKNKQKVYFHLPLEYDCCSDCLEDFPHRIHYSEQSFQEELSDNYRVFLPNNYRDLDGETGEITNLFKLANNLFVHTEEALWQLQNSRRERVNDGVVTYIGTGSFFDVPPQKVMDGDNGNSAGLQHKWGTLKTPYGYFFVSENQRRIYKFDGKQLNPISNIGLSNWFKENIEIQTDKDYKKSSTYEYPYRDNPSNELGTGFILTYDSKKERILVTKKDYILSENIIEQKDFFFCNQDSQNSIFDRASSIIEGEAMLGWNFEGIENCGLVFSKQKVVSSVETRWIPNKDIIEARPGDETYMPISVVVNHLESEYKTIEGRPILEVIQADNSWTISFSLKANQGNGAWLSWHSYIPNFYIHVPESFYSWIQGSSYLWKHNKIGHFQTFYNMYKPFIFEYVSVSTPLTTRIWNHIWLQTEAQRYSLNNKNYNDEKDITFNKLVAYNTRQCTGEVTLKVKDAETMNANYMLNQVINSNDSSIIIDRTERDWFINDLRDIRINYSQPIWNKSIDSVQSEYFIDKTLNTSTLDVEKDWTQQESFRDKYLVVRFIFDNFVDSEPNVKLMLNYSIENEQESLH